MNANRIDQLSEWLITSLCNPMLQAAQQAHLPGLMVMAPERTETQSWCVNNPAAKTSHSAVALTSQGSQA